GHHLLAELDSILHERKVDGGCIALTRKFLDPLLRLVPHETGRDPEDSLDGVARPVERRDQRCLLVVAGNELRVAACRSVASGAAGLRLCRLALTCLVRPHVSGWGPDVARRARPLRDPLAR